MILLRNVACYGHKVWHPLTTQNLTGNFTAAKQLTLLIPIAHCLIMIRIWQRIHHGRLHGCLNIWTITRIHPLSLFGVLSPWGFMMFVRSLAFMSSVLFYLRLFRTSISFIFGVGCGGCSITNKCSIVCILPAILFIRSIRLIPPRWLLIRRRIQCIFIKMTYFLKLILMILALLAFDLPLEPHRFRSIVEVLGLTFWGLVSFFLFLNVTIFFKKFGWLIFIIYINYHIVCVYRCCLGSLSLLTFDADRLLVSVFSAAWWLFELRLYLLLLLLSCSMFLS